MKINMFMDSKIKKCIWTCDKYVLVSENSYEYKIMSITHELINEKYDEDLVNGIRLLLKMNGKKV